VPEVQAATSKAVLGPEGELVAVIAARTGTDRAKDLYPRLVAAAWPAATDLHLAADPPVPIVSLPRQALAGIAAGLPDPSAERH
jgi:transcriptional regulator MftR-like protein